MHACRRGAVCVAISALLVVGGAVALAIGALASTRQVRRSYPVTGAVEGLALRPRRRRHRDRRRRPARRRPRAAAPSATRSAARPSRAARQGRGLRRPLALPDLAARRRARSTTASSCPTTSRVDIRTSERRTSALRGYRGSAKVDDRARADRHLRLLRQLARRARRRRRIIALRGRLRAAAAVACARAAARSARCCPPAATTSTPRALRRARACAGSPRATTRRTRSRCSAAPETSTCEGRS